MAKTSYFTGGADYYSGESESVIIFANKQDSASLTVPIISDEIVECTEMFSIIINSTSLPCNVILGNPNSTTVKIMDERCM